MTDPTAERGKHPLIGMIVSWCHICATKRKPGRAPGHGEVVAMLGEQLILVRTIRENLEDTEPDHMLVLQLTDAGLLFFHNEAQWRIWWDWIEALPGSDSNEETEPSADSVARASRRH